MKRWAVLLVASVLTLPAMAAELNHVKMPNRISVGDTRLVLNGIGLREVTILKVDVYVGGLYLERKSRDAAEIIDSEQIKRMVMQFVRKVGRDDIVDIWNEGFEKNAAGNLPELRERIRTLTSWMTDLRRGDTLVFTYIPGQGVDVRVTDRDMGTIRGEDFAHALWSVWLGRFPPSEDLKRGLLGK